ncbi:putative aspartate aminotransferase [Dothidotthia symphoricarpi CBS 119687]|uniref:Putative aspartate aminotransferase n=1 Tax=Dothidotthia symphoricarpi CBS 119687 TaxID=1392245 RepID=A0A6A6AF06_9PLEO|nr:putative aspartate aminotransferase [Dothidotthia symphoricarpi CBS 119687]KAF2129695.1 putative aspartate aminotransferase [Dothidotthia symphoricarpi CBS 119687]
MLSQRAQDQVPSSASNEMWDVMKDPWNRHDSRGYVNLGVAENHLMQAELKEFLANHINLYSSVLTYQDGPLGSQRLRQALARFLTRQLKAHRPVEASQIIVTNGVSSALEHTVWALANPGDAFLLGRPYYGEVTLSLRPRVRTVPVTFGELDPLSLPAVGCYEEALMCAREQGIVVKGLLLCSPHNPLGRCYPRDVLQALLLLCERFQIHLVSDEVYALSVFSEPGFVSVLSLDLDGIINPALVHVLWGVSKDFGANGWRIGCLVSGNYGLQAALGSVAIYSYPSSITDHVVAQMLEDDRFTTGYLEENRRRLASAYTFTTDFLRRHAIPFTAGTHAALFVWADLGKAYRRRHPELAGRRAVVEEVKEALRKQKVYVAWGGNFDSESLDMFRIGFAHPRDYMEEGLRRISWALGSGVPGQLGRGNQGSGAGSRLTPTPILPASKYSSAGIRVVLVARTKDVLVISLLTDKTEGIEQLGKKKNIFKVASAWKRV